MLTAATLFFAKRIQLRAKFLRVEIGRKLGPCWPMFCSSGMCRVETVTLDEFWPVCQRYKSTTTLRIFWRQVDLENGTPKLRLCQLNILYIVHSYHLLLKSHPRPGTLGAGGFLYCDGYIDSSGNVSTALESFR